MASTRHHPASTGAARWAQGRWLDLKGRGAHINPESRFHAAHRVADLDHLEEASRAHEAVAPVTSVTHEAARSVLTRNQSPDIPFDQSINPYRGCEHGCIYCYARPTHAYLGLSPGLDFETKLIAKDKAAHRLREEFLRPGYRPSPVAMGTATDAYQPVERRLRIAREILAVFDEFRHPLTITTKSALILRDLDLLRSLARDGLVHVWVSLATLDAQLARALEPRAASPARRIEAVRQLSEAGVSCGVLVAPVIPALTDTDVEAVLAAAAQAGARHAGYVNLRLPLEVRQLFIDWLETHFPLRAKHVMSRVDQMHVFPKQVHAFGQRMTGTGIFADLLRQRFTRACRELGLSGAAPTLPVARFSPPEAQGSLF